MISIFAKPTEPAGYVLSQQRRKVLDVFISKPGAELTGAELGQLSGLSPGVIYPVLYGMEDRGLVSARWEPGNKPRRRLYKLEEEIARELRS